MATLKTGWIKKSTEKLYAWSHAKACRYGVDAKGNVITVHDKIVTLNDSLAKTIYNLNDYKYTPMASADGALSKFNNAVTMTGYAIVKDGTFLPAQGATTILQLPASLRPTKEIYAPATMYRANDARAGFVIIRPDGGVNLYNRTDIATLTSVTFSASYDVG